MELLKIENLSFTYPLRPEKTLDSLSFSVSRGDFIAVCGATGSGKTTLMRMLKRELSPLGEVSGNIYFKGEPLSRLSDRDSAAKIGYIMQRPEQQIVADTVWHELAFGLESLGIKRDEIRRRVSETACYFGIEGLFEKSVAELSGGQKQLLCLASVMVMQPELLLLDEPTAQLDPVAASVFISTVAKLNLELSLTVIITEHRLEEVIPASDKLLALDKGCLFVYNNTRDALSALRSRSDMLEGMPSAVRIFSQLDINAPCPLNVREGRDFIEAHFDNTVRSLPLPEPFSPHGKKPALEFSDVYFRYSRELPDVLRGLSFTVYENEVFCILGGNGSGKSTMLAAACALIKPFSGTIKVFGRPLKSYSKQSLYRDCVSFLPQDVQTCFLRNTVYEELNEVASDMGAFPFDLSDLFDRHPYDLSGGQGQLVALAKVLATRPRLLLLDEPTKGLDAHTKTLFTGIIGKLKASGVTVICVTHDVEFAAMCADRCAMFFSGAITSSDTPRSFFSGNNFYTTSASRMTRGYYDLISTVEDAVKICRINGKRGKDL